MMSANALTAERMAVAVRTDPQFRVPERPKLVEGLAMVPLETGLLLEGGPERQLLRGEASVTLLPALLALLDGTRNVQELTEALPGETGNRVGKAISLLYGCGLLEEGRFDQAALPARTDAQGATFLSRIVDSTRVNRNAGEAIARLSEAAVPVVAPGSLGPRLVAELERTGVGDPHLLARPEDLDRAATLAVGIAIDAEDEQILGRLDAATRTTGAPWLRVARAPGGLDLGPRFEGGLTACHRCLSQLHGGARDPTPGDARSAAFDELLVGLAAAEVTALVSRVGGTQSTAGVTRIVLSDLRPRRLLVPPVPGCPVCCPLPEGAQWPRDALPVGYVFERSVDFPARHLLNVKDHQNHYKESNLALQRAGKSYPSAPAVPLAAALETPMPEGAFRAGVPAGPLTPGRVDLAVLTGLLIRSFGLRDGEPGSLTVPGKVGRWAPTGGNLGSVQVYVAALDVDGLEAGLWFYEPWGRALQRLPGGEDAAALRALLAAAGGGAIPAAAPAALVLTAALARVGRKYSTFAYRSVHLDAGCALAQLGVVAEGYGLEPVVAARWNDDVILDALRLDAEQEPVTALFALRPRAAL